MHRNMRKVLASALAMGLAVTSLAGCSKKESFDATKALLTLEGGSSIDAGTANLIFRYEQAEFENGIGSFIKSYYGDIWNSDLYGTGEAYGNLFKEQILEEMQHMLLDEQHASEYDVALSDDEMKAISEAAAAFLAANDDEVLEKMSATTESAERMLTLYTIRQKVQDAIAAGVDTEVSDEEAAQRTVRYVQFTAETEEETEEETEDLSEALTEDGESVDESADAAVEVESEVKTQSAAETEAEDAAEAVAEESTESETETEDPALVAARLEALQKAEAFLESVAAVTTSEAFEEAASEASADDSSIITSTFTFGEDDTYPDAAIIDATRDLEDNTLVGYPVQVNDSYYVLFVEDAFDEDATADKKDEIVEERKSDAIEAVEEAWENGTSAEEASTEAEGEAAAEPASFTFDSEAWASLIFDISLTYEEETEIETEGISESGESVAEQVTE